RHPEEDDPGKVLAGREADAPADRQNHDQEYRCDYVAERIESQGLEDRQRPLHDDEVEPPDDDQEEKADLREESGPVVVHGGKGCWSHRSDGWRPAGKPTDGRRPAYRPVR